MHNDDSAPSGRDVGRSGDPILTLHPHFPDGAVQMFNVGLAHLLQPNIDDKFNNPSEGRARVGRERRQLSGDIFIQKIQPTSIQV